MSFKVQEHQVHTCTLASASAYLQRPLLLEHTVKMLDWHQVHVRANQSFAGWRLKPRDPCLSPTW